MKSITGFTASSALRGLFNVSSFVLVSGIISYLCLSKIQTRNISHQSQYCNPSSDESRELNHCTTMAEVLGAVASGFAIAGVVVKGGTAVAKLRRLWAEIKDAPDTINDLLIQLEILEPMLADFESQFTDDQALLRAGIFNNAGAVRSAKYCRMVMDELRQTVENLSVEIESSRRRTRGAGKVKVVLRKDVLSRLQEQLERAVRFMNLAHLGYQK